MIPSQHLPDIFTAVLDTLAVAGVITCFITQFILVRMVRALREQLASQKLALSALADNNRKSGSTDPKVVPHTAGSRRLHEVTRVDRKNVAKAVLAKTVLISKPVQKPKVVEKLYVAKSGENLGEIDIPTIRAMLKSGELSARDHFFEINKQIWSSFDGLPGFCT